VRASPLKPLLERCVERESARLQAAVLAAARPDAGVTPPLKPAVAWMPYGPESAEACLEIAADLGSPAAEYAAIRRGCGLLDGVHRGTLVVEGADRAGFLQRMVTQDLKAIGAGEVRESFWLNRKGRVQADLLIAEFGDRMLVDVDRFAAAAVAKELGDFLFSEDCRVIDATDAWGRMALHGAAAMALLAACGMPTGSLETDLRCAAATLSGEPAWLARRDQAGVPGVEIFAPIDRLPALFEAMLQAGAALGAPVRPVGWHAWNVARVEAGTPLFLVDFGREALPHETGLLNRRVSFRKGCYLGQEVVARMESLGKPKQRLVALRMEEDRLPVAGSEVTLASGEAVGAITSSSPAPMLGSACIALAMVRFASGEPGTRLRVAAEGDWATAVVQPRLRFLPGGER
jgi:folate-binding protein YgfZ